MGSRSHKHDEDGDESKPRVLSRLIPLLRQLYRPVTVASAAAVVVAGLFLPRLKGLLPDLEQRSEYRLTATQIEITAPPHWVPHDLVSQVVERADLPEELSLLDENLVGEVAEAFRLSPWVEEVVSVSKSFPARVSVVLSYRRPVAMVEVKQGHYPIDAHGVLLPPQEFSVADTRAYPTITGVVSTPQGAAGTEWGDPVVEEAAQLAAELACFWKTLGLTAIVCPRAAESHARIDEGVFLLEARGGTRIIWGHAPGTDHPGELSTKQKIGRLEEYVKRFGGFDRPHGPYRIDIRHWRDISRTPLSAELEWLDQVRE
ncbi:MAG: cell division protein FtsQ/DivIB [Deltaproteobacteria bacterium]